MARNSVQADVRRRLASLRMKPRPGLWLAKRANRDGVLRYYFQPSRFDAGRGWKMVRLHDKDELPISSETEAKAACQELAEIYLAWKQGREGFGPELIDKFGRPVGKRITHARSAVAGAPGTIAAIAADFMDSDEFSELKASTQDDYRLCLDALVKKFGVRLWQSISAKEAKTWIREKAVSHPSMAHQWYRTCRAMLNKTRLVYDERDHPGYVPEAMNPFESLNVGLPRAQLIVWPQEAIAAMVKLADELGRPSLGDAIVTMAWLGVRRQDWLAWPANAFDTPYLAWDTEKTDAPVTIPWTVIPDLNARIEAAKIRHQRAAVRSTTFFVDDVGERPWNANRFHAAFGKLRATLAERHESFATRYAVKHYPGDPLRIPTTWLTMRVLRHTCITALHDAGCVREQIRAITGHTIASINEVLDRYTKLTADQAGAALAKRLAHEGGSLDATVMPLKKR
jgi:integrase